MGVRAIEVADVLIGDEYGYVGDHFIALVQHPVSQGGKAPEERRQRTANGTGATHLKTYYCKLRADAMDHLDKQVNEWLDSHPEIEVKFVNVTIGVMTGKISEPAMFINVWV